MRQLVPHTRFIAAILLSSVLASIGLIGGLALQLVKRDVVAFLPLLIALPALNAITGNYAALVSAHLADPENHKQQTKRLLLALLVSLPFCIVTVSAMSLGVAWIKGFAVDQSIVWDFVRTVGVMLYALVAFLFTVVYVTRAIIARMQLNVDDTLIPIANTLASVLTLSAIALISSRFV